MDLKAITILTATSSSVLVFDAVERKVNSVKKKEWITNVDLSERA